MLGLRPSWADTATNQKEWDSKQCPNDARHSALSMWRSSECRLGVSSHGVTQVTACCSDVLLDVLFDVLWTLRRALHLQCTLDPSTRSGSFDYGSNGGLILRYALNPSMCSGFRCAPKALAFQDLSVPQYVYSKRRRVIQRVHVTSYMQCPGL